MQHNKTYEYIIYYIFKIYKYDINGAVVVWADWNIHILYIYIYIYIYIYSIKPKHVAKSCKFIKYLTQNCVRLYFVAYYLINREKYNGDVLAMNCIKGGLKGEMYPLCGAEENLVEWNVNRDTGVKTVFKNVLWYK